MTLAETQALFHALLTGEAAADDARFTQCFTGDARLDARGRVDVYVGMYRDRLVEALAATFPMVERLVGHERFHALAERYLAARPSTHPDIGLVGRHLAAFLREENRERSDASELAALEQLRSDVFSAAPSAAVPWASLVALGEQLAEARLRFVPAFGLLSAQHDLGALWKQLLDEPPTAPAPVEQVLAVWRRDFDPLHLPLEPREANALALARGGATLAEAFEAFADAADPAAEAFKALQSWFDTGWIAEIRI